MYSNTEEWRSAVGAEKEPSELVRPVEMLNLSLEERSLGPSLTAGSSPPNKRRPFILSPSPSDIWKLPEVRAWAGEGEAARKSMSSAASEGFSPFERATDFPLSGRSGVRGRWREEEDWERNVLVWREGEGWCIALPFGRLARERSSSPRLGSEEARERPVKAVAASTKELKLGSDDERGAPLDEVAVEGRIDVLVAELRAARGDW